MAKEALTKIDLGYMRIDCGETRRAVLVLSTDKFKLQKSIRSDAYVWWIGKTTRRHAFGVGCGGDFELVLKSVVGARATQKVIDTQHAAVFTPEVVEMLTTRAKVMYRGETECDTQNAATTDNASVGNSMEGTAA